MTKEEFLKPISIMTSGIRWRLSSFLSRGFETDLLSNEDSLFCKYYWALKHDDERDECVAEMIRLLTKALRYVRSKKVSDAANTTRYELLQETGFLDTGLTENQDQLQVLIPLLSEWLFRAVEMKGIDFLLSESLSLDTIKTLINGRHDQDSIKNRIYIEAVKALGIESQGLAKDFKQLLSLSDNRMIV